MRYAGLDSPKLLVDGELVDAEGGATDDDIDPATEECIGVAADASPGDVMSAKET